MKLIPLSCLLMVLIFVSCESQSTKAEKPYISEESNKIKNSNSFDHIKHIRKVSKKRETDGDQLDQEYFVDYVIENLLEKPEYKKYITDRNLLRKLENKVCWDNYVLISDTLFNGDKCKIEIKTQDFVPQKHKLKYQNKSNFLIEVDGEYPFGAVYSKHPREELESLEIKINGKSLKTKIESYKNIYEPEFCNFGGYIRITEAYEDGDNIYIYLHGGLAADSYFAKLIFDKTGFVTSIIADYSPLSEYGSFGDHFIGF
ncbi:hypothetical protein [Tenacibaculum finnmarkense]|uniref:hypothetical protein n=1 Tax=Tenacibaculum finnmarkense TaxID=2781243 RepID=UPI001EFB157E|nr:hypothetical protein [Tenacibaculum finnmarkense]MCG8804033.1 hypothetical protein [Tenacibaculum finnmarkense]MCG8826760.1 hypothetical protein [Tenacibaculum finnmarkense]